MSVYEVVDTLAKGKSGDIREMPVNQRGEHVLQVDGQNVNADYESEFD